MFATASEILPAAGVALSVTVILCVVQLVPFGEGMCLVRVDPTDPGTAFLAAARAHVAIVNRPAPGFAVVYGQASTIRSAFGLAVPWKGKVLCSASP